MKRPGLFAAVAAAHVLALWPWSCAAPQTKAPAPPAPVRLVADHEFAKQGPGDYACDPSYRGIGVRAIEGYVFEVAPGGPAERAGIRRGDEIENHEVLGGDRYDVGTILRLTVKRGEHKFNTPVRTERICQEKR